MKPEAMDMDTGTGKRSSYRLLLAEDDSVIAGEIGRAHV